MQTAFKLQQRIAWQSSYNDMRDETSLEHERVFKQLYYHPLPFDQIVYSFLLSLSLFNRKFYQPFSAVPECRNIRCNRKPCNKTQMNHNIFFLSAVNVLWQNTKQFTKRNDQWMVITRKYNCLSEIIHRLSVFPKYYLKLIFKFWFVYVEVIQ